LEFSKKGKSTLFHNKAQQEREAPTAEHDRAKKRYLELSRPFLTDLGVTNKQHELIPAMSRKWKQINKFIDVFSHALATSPITLDKPVTVADCGSGKGYL
ncbi:methyltransferase, partial [Pseudomonas graminis]